MMRIEQIIAAEQKRYTDAFRSTLESHRSDEGALTGELLISINNQAIPYPYRYLRVDAATLHENGSPKIFQFDLGEGAKFEPVGASIGDGVLEVYPFRWDSVQFLFDRPSPNLQQLEGWLTRWLDVEDAQPHAEDGLSGAIHSCSQIENSNGWWYLTIDFGTAPADTLLEFIELLAFQKMSRIVVRTDG